jgi:hypothetical protein
MGACARRPVSGVGGDGRVRRAGTFHDLRAYCTTHYKLEHGVLPDLHANPATAARVYDRSKEVKRGAL